jgi:hypothetical protein
MSVDYQYSIATDFQAGVQSDVLVSEIKAAGIAAGLLSVATAKDVCTITFQSALSGAEKTALDGVVSAHDAIVARHSEFKGVVALSVTDVEITVEAPEWETIGGAVLDMELIIPEPAERSVHLQGMYQSAAGTLGLRLVETINGTDVVLASSDLADTNGVWTTFQFDTASTPKNGVNEYRLEANRSDALSTGRVKFAQALLFRLY